MWLKLLVLVTQQENYYHYQYCLKFLEVSWSAEYISFADHGFFVKSVWYAQRFLLQSFCFLSEKKFSQSCDYQCKSLILKLVSLQHTHVCVLPQSLLLLCYASRQRTKASKWRLPALYYIFVLRLVLVLNLSIICDPSVFLCVCTNNMYA